MTFYLVKLRRRIAGYKTITEARAEAVTILKKFPKEYNAIDIMNGRQFVGYVRYQHGYYGYTKLKGVKGKVHVVRHVINPDGTLGQKEDYYLNPATGGKVGRPLI